MTTTMNPDLDGVETHADGMPVLEPAEKDNIRKSAVTASVTPAAVAPTGAEPIRPPKHWTSGFCGGIKGQPCNDGRHKNKAGEPIRWCLYIAENGDKAPHKFLYCACGCHDDVRVPEDPNFKVV